MLLLANDLSIPRRARIGTMTKNSLKPETYLRQFRIHAVDDLPDAVPAHIYYVYYVHKILWDSCVPVFIIFFVRKLSYMYAE